MLRVGARKTAAIGLLTLPLALSGCWYGPEDLGPFALGESGGELVVIACEDLVLRDVALLQRIVVNGDRQTTELIAETRGEQQVKRGEPLTLQLVTSGQGLGPTGGIQPDAYYYVESLTRGGEGVTATFRPGSTGVPTGMWLGSDQSVNATPCDYWSE